MWLKKYSGSPKTCMQFPSFQDREVLFFNIKSFGVYYVDFVGCSIL